MLINGFHIPFAYLYCCLLFLPPTGETQDLNDDTFYGAADLTTLTGFAKNQFIGAIPSRPVLIEKLSAAMVTIAVGDTTHVTVHLLNEDSSYTPGFGVVFSIDPSSTGTATILGGDGHNLVGHRYDMTGAVAVLARSNVVIRVDSVGTIKINALSPLCGSDLNMGRYCAALNMAEPFIITGN